MEQTHVERLREDLEAAGYRGAAIESLLGSEADAARQRGVFAPARHAIARREASGLKTLTRLFLLGEAVDTDALDAALPRLGVSGAISIGLIDGVDSETCIAKMSLNPVSLPRAGGGDAGEVHDWWVLSDLDDQLRQGPAEPHHVMGVGGATRSLLLQLQAPGVSRALDLGTGCGIVALVLAQAGAAEVVATDISERALMFARANAVLNGYQDRIEFRQGDLFEPVVGEQFDLIASNPPFVISPQSDDTTPRYEYRDAGLEGDALAERVVTEAPGYLADRGTLVCLANWESPWGANGLTRVQGWVERAAEQAGSLAAWVIERDRVTPLQYAETWVRDGGTRPGQVEFERRLETWLADFARRHVVAIGLGVIRVQRQLGASASKSVFRLEHEPGSFAEHPGPEFEAAFSEGVRASRMSDDDVLGCRWVTHPAVSEQREHRPGQESPRNIVLRTTMPIARAITADPMLAAAVGACDGELTLEQISDALATLLELDVAATRMALVSSARELAWCGMLAAACE